MAQANNDEYRRRSKLLQQKADEIWDAIHEVQGTPTPEQLEQLAAISLAQEQIPTPLNLLSTEKIIVAIIVFLAFYASYILSSTKTDSIDINISANFSAITFQSTDRQVLESLRLIDVVVRGFSDFQLESERSGQIFRAPTAKEVRVPGLSTTNLIFGTAKTIYAIETTNTENRFILKLLKPEAHHIRTNESLVFINTQGNDAIIDGERKLTSESSRAIFTLSLDQPQILEIEFSVDPAAGIQLIRQIKSTLLQFLPLQKQERDSLVWLGYPSTLGGSIKVPSLKEKQYSIFEGDCLKLTESNGNISSIRIKGHEISLSFQGIAAEAALGNCKTPRDLKPSVLELWRENNTFSLIWGGAASIIAALLAIIKWGSLRK